MSNRNSLVLRYEQLTMRPPEFMGKRKYSKSLLDHNIVVHGVPCFRHGNFFVSPIIFKCILAPTREARDNLTFCTKNFTMKCL